jgi:hypothetical protein
MSKFEDHYINWRITRFNGTLKYINESFFKDKTLLEVGCGHGDNGNLFQNLGANVTCTDARQEHIINGKLKYPMLNFSQLDCDIQHINNKYDIILHWGLLYHLDNIENHIEDVCNNCDYLILETEVCDSNDITILKVDENNSYDQSFHFKGSRPSPNVIESLLDKNNFEYKLIKDSILNSYFHIYDWDITNTNTWKHGLRRFWICWRKGIESPLKSIPNVDNTCNIEDITIILQGLIHPKVDINKTINEYKKYGKIILSIYKHQYDYILNNVKDLNNVEIILNDMELYVKENNDIYKSNNTHYYQLSTTKKAIDSIFTKYVIKSRVDHYYSNLDIFIDHCIKTDKITSSSLFVRGINQYKYHLSDCLFMGKTDEIKKVIELSIQHYPFPNVYLHPQEVQLWKPYIFSKLNSYTYDTIDNDMNIYIKTLSDIFEIIDVNKLYPYEIKVSNHIITQIVDNSNRNFICDGVNDTIIQYK